MVCPSNEEAVAAVRAVAAAAPEAPNPLLILGSAAEGKTHLVRALVAAFRRQHPRARALVMSPARLERLWRRSKLHGTLRRWRTVDARPRLLVLEDVQFLDQNSTWRMMLPGLIGDLRSQDGFVVLTRDPADVPADSALTRNARVVRLHAPDFALRAAVAKRAAARFGLSIPDDVANLIADHCDNLRQVQGAVMRVHAASKLVDASANDRAPSAGLE